MTDERYKAIMADLGYPNSLSLLSALKQVASEAGRERALTEREECAIMAENFSTRDGYEIAHAIRARGAW